MMARSNHLPTVPSLLADELATNPFLRAGEASVKAALGMETASDAEVFAEIRRRKDSF
jgi:hydroxyacylglutathione hydrolase